MASEDIGTLLFLLDKIFISLHKTTFVLRYLEDNSYVRTATQETGKIATSTSQLVGLLNGLPSPSDSSDESIQKRKNLEESSIISRKQILLLIGETKKLVLRQCTKDSLLKTCDSAFTHFFELYSIVWTVGSSGGLKEFPWSSDSRSIYRKLSAFLSLSKEISPSGSSGNHSLYENIAKDILQSLSSQRDSDSYLDSYPVPLQALLLQISELLDSFISSGDLSTVEEDLDLLLIMLKDSLLTVDFSIDDNSSTSDIIDENITITSALCESDSISSIIPENVYCDNNKDSNGNMNEIDTTLPSSIDKQDNSDNVKNTIEVAHKVEKQKENSIETIQTDNIDTQIISEEVVNNDNEQLEEEDKEIEDKEISSLSQQTDELSPMNNDREGEERDDEEEDEEGEEDEDNENRGNDGKPRPFLRMRSSEARTRDGMQRNFTRSQTNESSTTFTSSRPQAHGTERGRGIFGAQRLLSQKKKQKQKEKVHDLSEAEAIAEIFLEKFVEIRDAWLVYPERERNDFLQSLASKLSEKSKPINFFQPAHGSSKVQKLEHTLRVKSAGDLFSVDALKKYTDTERRIAENTLQIIVHSSLVVIDPQEKPYEDTLVLSVVQLFITLIDTVNRIPTLNELMREKQDELAQELGKQASSVDLLYVVDENIVRAAKGQGIKLISYQMKINIWNHCNTLRIFVAMLLKLLETCVDPSQRTTTTLFQLYNCIPHIIESLSNLLCQVATAKCIETQVSFFSKRTASVEDEDINIWEEKTNDGTLIWVAEENEKATTKQVKTGSLNKLVQSLTSDKNLNQTFLKSFIATYRSFTTPWALLSKLIERYNVPPNTISDSKRAQQIQLRVAIVVKYWVDTQFYDFDEDLINSLQNFCTRMNEDGLTDMAQRLQELITAKVKERNQRQESLISIPPTNLMCFSEMNSISSIFLNISIEELSKQLTLVDYNIYKSIRVQELLNTAWNSDKLKHRSPNITHLLGRLNEISNFFCSMILWQQTKKERAQFISLFIRLGIHLRKLNNFHTLMGVVVALNRSSVSRLKFSLAECEPKLLQQFKTLESLMDPTGSFKNYRKAIQNTKLPALPYLGVVLTDLTFIEDGNPDFIEDSVTGKKVINFTKRGMIYELVQTLLDYQNAPYMFPSFEPITTLVTEFLCETEKQQYNLSLLHEPRGVDVKSIL